MQLHQGPRTGGARLPVRGNVTPSYAVDQQHDAKLQNDPQGRRMREIVQALDAAEKTTSRTRVRTLQLRDQKIKKDVAPFAQQLLGIAHHEKAPKPQRLEAIAVLGRLGRAYAEPAAEEGELPALAKHGDGEIAAAAKAALLKFGPSKPRRATGFEAPLFPGLRKLFR